ncbi:MAG TPA: efflux RND transporter periplasmic adaptor subunit [Rhodocyclaceae bacterium]|nr:efflux RND transporter periplasmic adaptor subunit [Rhodocyclaceae bacterium]
MIRLKFPPTFSFEIRRIAAMRDAGKFLFIGTASLLTLSACQQEAPVEVVDIRPVRAVVVTRGVEPAPVSLSGRLAAENEAAVAFRIGGRMVARHVNVGDIVKPGTPIANLDAQDETNAEISARAALDAALGRQVQARGAYQRQSTLLKDGFTTRGLYDEAQEALNSSTAAVESARAQLQIARDRVGFTRLVANVHGTVTARGAEPGEVVQAGQMVVRVARPTEGIDAVVHVPASMLRAPPQYPTITVHLSDAPEISVFGRVREIAPQADPMTGTFEIRIALQNPPPEMRLGAVVTAQMRLDAQDIITVPANALTSFNSQPAVWVLDRATETVSMRNIEIAGYQINDVVVKDGLNSGDVVVTAGVQSLRPGQQVRLVGANQ